MTPDPAATGAATRPAASEGRRDASPDAQPPPLALLLIGGNWTPAREGGEFEVGSPATRDPVGYAADGSRADAAQAIDAAADALPSWAGTPARDRGALLERAADLVEARADDLARLISLECGKPLAEARGEPAYAAGFLRFAGLEAEAAVAGRAHEHPAGKVVHTARRPVGVAGLITVWNFPAAGVTRPLAAALAAGCTTVVKPAEQAPLTAAAICALLVDAGIPPGALNLVSTADPAPVARELIESPQVRKLNFTGSADVGKGLLRDAADQVKRVTLELGGHAPFLVLADADIDAAVEGAVRSKFRNSGQTCVCLNRIYAHEDVVEGFVERFVRRVRALRVGDPLADDTDVGPLIDAEGLRRVEDHVADALSKGASLLTGGRRVSVPGHGAGLFYEPTVLAGATAEMRVMREETFGPVAPIAAFSDEEEAIARANELPWGLAAFVYARDGARAARIAGRLEYGIVGINDPLPAAPHLPFGGIKQSGLGSEGGRLGIEEFLDTQLVSAAPT